MCSFLTQNTKIKQITTDSILSTRNINDTKSLIIPGLTRYMYYKLREKQSDIEAEQNGVYGVTASSSIKIMICYNL